MILWLAIASSLISAPLRVAGDASVDGWVSDPRGSAVVRKKWISEMMVDVEMRFDMKANVSDECRRDYGIYKLHAENQTVWAVRMMESTEWPRIGLFSGATVHLGQYAECLRSRGPGIRGQYCVAQATYNFPSPYSDRPESGYTSWPDERASAWNVIKTYEKNPFRKSRRLLIWAMCIPSSCTPTDLQTSLNNSLYPVFKAQELDITVNVNPVLCQIDDPAHAPVYRKTGKMARYSNNECAEMVYCYLLAEGNGNASIQMCGKKYPNRQMFKQSRVINFLILMTVVCTIYDLIFGTKRTAGIFDSSVNLIKCFSMLQNYKSLTHYSPTNTYRFLYFLKVLLMLIIIWGHATILYFMFPKFETEEMETSYNPWSMELLAGVILNPFFTISGFLKAFHFDFSAKTDNGIHFFVRTFVMKYLRMVPMNGLIILWFYFLLPKLEDAPLSPEVKLSEMKYCAENWWINMLAIQNFVNRSEMCQLQTWYIAADLQLFVIGTVLLMILKMNTIYGYCLMILTSVYSVFHSFVIMHSIASYRLFTDMFNVDPMNHRDSQSSLFVPHMMTLYRVGPYMVGLVAALITKSLMNRGFKFSSMQLACLLFITSVIGFGSQLHVFSFYIVDRPVDRMAMAMFGVLQPILFVLPFASLICIYFVSGLGIFKPLFEQSFYVPLGKLSFSVYLVGIGLQSYHMFNQRKMLPRFNRVERNWWIMGDFVFVLATAVFFYFVCEGPMNSLIDTFIKPYLTRKRNMPQKENTNTENLNLLDSDASQPSAGIKGTEKVTGRITRLNNGLESSENKKTEITSGQSGKKKLK